MDPGLLGDPERPIVPDHEVETKGHVLHYEVVRPEATNTDDFPVFGNEKADQPERRSLYELHLPYTIVLRLGWGGEKGMVYFFVSQPISKDKCRGWCVTHRSPPGGGISLGCGSSGTRFRPLRAGWSPATYVALNTA